VAAERQKERGRREAGGERQEGGRRREAGERQEERDASERTNPKATLVRAYQGTWASGA
jgi:hypothetical protein